MKLTALPIFSRLSNLASPRSVLALGIGSLLLLTPVQAQARLDCSELLLSIARHFGDQTLQKQLEAWVSIPPELPRAEKVPNWSEFEHLEKIVLEITRFNRRHQKAGKTAQLDRKYDKAIELVKDRLALDFTGYQNDPARYAPAEYERKQAYQKLLRGLRDELPPSIRFKLPAIPPLDKSPIRAQAEKLIRDREAQYLKLLEKSGGWDSLRNEVENHPHPEVQKFVSAVRNGELEMSMACHSAHRKWVQRIGFHNQYVTKTSSGYNSRTYRSEAEAKLLGGIDLNTYRALHDEVKPKYGFLKSRQGSALGANYYSVKRYGDDVYVFRSDRVKSRTTMMLGDSLMRSPHSSQVQTWYGAFIPWTFHLLLAPIVIHPGGSTFPPKLRGFDLLSLDYRPLLLKQLPVDETRVFDYVEMQYYGDLSLDDVTAFEFKKDPPRGEFLAELLNRGIEIRRIVNDYNNEPWQPTAEMLEEARPFRTNPGDTTP